MATTTKDKIAKIRALVEPAITQASFELVDVELVSERGDVILRLYIDTIPPGTPERGVTVEHCADVSRLVGGLLDADETIDGVALEKWDNQQEMHDGPAAQAFHMLGELPLDDGRGEGGGTRLGRLRFIEGDHPGSNLTYVEAPDLATLACLQNRLNELGQNLAIEIRKW